MGQSNVVDGHENKEKAHAEAPYINRQFLKLFARAIPAGVRTHWPTIPYAGLMSTNMSPKLATKKSTNLSPNSR